jgi:streptogramin lyase
VALAGAPGAAAGTVTVFSVGVTANSQPIGITTGPDGNIWFTQAGRTVPTAAMPAVGRIDPATGVVTEFTAGLSTGSAPTGITVGSDGNLWIAERTRGSVARVTPAGAIEELPALVNDDPALSTPPSVESIVTGPDGNLWFTKDNGGAATIPDKIVRMNPVTRTMTEFPLSPVAGPEAIINGGDGNLYFTEADEDNGHLARITTAGVVTEFQNGLPAGLGALTVGPDGGVWFVLSQTNGIGRFNVPNHAVSVFGVPTANIDTSTGLSEGPEGITAGIDGNVWFAEGDFGTSIGRITPNGDITEFPNGAPASSASGEQITTGPDGNLWFTIQAKDSLTGTDAIGRMTLDSPPRVVTGDATNLVSTTATLNAGINPVNSATSAGFEYGPTSAYGQTTTPKSLPAGTSLVPLSATLTGLTPGALYHFRATGTNGFGTTQGEDHTFTAGVPPLPTVITGAADRVDRHGATMNGTVTPHGGPTTYTFEYGTTSRYGSQSTPKSAGAGSTAVPAAAVAESLQEDRVYHYRLTATNASGTTLGADRTFSTKRVAVRSFTARVRPRHATRFPYGFTFTGKVVPPASALRSAACKGRVSARARNGRTTILTRSTKLKKNCSYSLRLTFANARLLSKSGKLAITLGFQGNDVLKAKTLRPVAVAYG